MAKLSSEKIYFMREPFQRDVRVLKDGMFRVKYPEIIKDTTGVSEVEGKTLDVVLHKFNQTLKAFEESQTTSKKVILYDIQDDISFSNGTAWPASRTFNAVF